MFSSDFYPTPKDVIDQMLLTFDVAGKTILEPSAGNGNIVDACIGSGAFVIACEKDINLKKIVQSKCKVIADDFLTVQSEAISHIDAIIMNPPFSADEKHILHAYDIAPAGCTILALCNYQTYSNAYSAERKRLKDIVGTNGSIINLGACFDTAERTTHTKIGFIQLRKAGEKSNAEFDGFFMEDEVEAQENGIMPYNAVREIVNRYVAAVRLFDQQLEVGQQMHELTREFFTGKLAFTCSKDNAPFTRNEFKKDLQKEAWAWVFSKMNMKKYATRGLKEDINKFVEQQQSVPFTMRNIYRMIEIVVGTHSQRMDKAIIEVFDKMTSHYHENRYNLEGWKTNSHYLMNEKFIMPGICYQDKWNKGREKIDMSHNTDRLDDFVKALCYLTGSNYDEIESLRSHISKHNYSYGELFDYAFFEVRCYKKGTAHFKFKDRDLWATFNQHVARINGYPLPEGLKAKKAA